MPSFGTTGILKSLKCCRQERREFLNCGNAVARDDGNSEIVEMLSLGTSGILKLWKCCRSGRRGFMLWEMLQMKAVTLYQLRCL